MSELHGLFKYKFGEDLEAKPVLTGTKGQSAFANSVFASLLKGTISVIEVVVTSIVGPLAVALSRVALMEHCPVAVSCTRLGWALAVLQVQLDLT